MMNRKWMIGCAILASALIAAPAYAAETESAFGISNHVTTELDDGVMTIRIKGYDESDKDAGFYWEAYQGDKGDASRVELLTQSDSEEGLAYAGSFRAIEDGEDTIRLVYTDGNYVKEYLDFNVVTEDGKIKETVGGGQGFETTGEDLAPYLEGTWKEDGGDHIMNVALADDGALAFTISEEGDDTATYTMNAYYDSIKDALVYWDGEALGTDAAETEAESEGASAGSGVFVIEDLSEQSDEEPKVGIVWSDSTFGNNDVNMFIKAE